MAGGPASPPVISIDGTVVAPERATISVLDRGVLYGDGCFEVLRTWHGVAVELAAHLDRLADTAAALRLAFDRPRLAEAVQRTLAAAGPGEHRIRIVLTRGPGGLAAPLASLGPGASIVIVEPLPPPPAELSAVVVDWPLARRAGPGRKTLAYLDHVIARELARDHGADEALRCDPDGQVVEGATCNLFVVDGGRVMTPPAEGVLPGIVRGRVLALCAAAGIPATVGPLTVARVRGAGELFVTSSLRGVVAVTRLDGEPRRAGPVTRQLAGAYVTAMTGSSPRSGL